MAKDYLAALLAAITFAVLAWVVAKNRPRLHDWWDRHMRAADRAEELAEDQQLLVLRDQVTEGAKKLGKTIAVKRSGNRVTWSDGHVSTHIPDYQTYRYKMEARQVDPFTTFNGEPPTPLSSRD